VLCDTNGGTMPWEVEPKFTRAVKARWRSAGHSHPQRQRCGVANTLAAVREGAVQVQGTINGIGERCGNANLCTVIPNLELKMGLRCLPEGKPEQLYDLSHFVTEVANLTPNEHMAYVGARPLRTRAACTWHAMRRTPQSYQHIDPPGRQ
jgi:2-isopropylmalate synthase